MDDLKELVVAVVAGVIVHYITKAIDERPNRKATPKHMRKG